MGQLFKTIYFQDYPSTSSSKKNLKLAFSEKDYSLHQSISNLSSQELREILGYSSYKDIRLSAAKESLPLNTFCLRILKNNLTLFIKESEQLYLPIYSPPVFFNPIHATFKGGKKEPLHQWYPFLEGYSPKYVEEIIKNFTPNAHCILDPFAGTGTTPLTTAKLGFKSFYAEINPLLQYLVEIKTKALTLKSNIKSKVIEFLNNISENFDVLLKKHSPDLGLALTYQQVFGNSEFFDEETFEKVLKARSLVDSIGYNNPLASDFLNIAILSSLIPSSLLKRAGDLRFKNQRERCKKQIIFETAVSNQLNKIVIDLCKLKPIANPPILVCEDARNLCLLPTLEIDTIITSPPYLNGTNYFRNMKVELWFLRCLQKSKDLSLFREKAVTAGINAVSKNKKVITSHPKVGLIVNQLTQSAYDPRIPKMVGAYFRDMDIIFEGIKHHLACNATLAIDIGDSVYGGVHVPTDKILAELLNEKRLILKQEILLRKRLSRSGSPLRQVLLIFNNKRPKQKRTNGHKFHWENVWLPFKSCLPHQHEPFSKRNWGHPLHSLCSYQGKMKPSLAHYLVKIFVPKQGVFLDPFAGVGTIPFEGALQGHTVWGFEISPTARIIASAKVRKPDKVEVSNILDTLEDYLLTHELKPEEISALKNIRFNKCITDYYEEKTLREILAARHFFKENHPQSPSECLVVACLLHILHGNRPYALSRRSHGITPFAPSGLFEYRPLMPRLRKKIQKSFNINYPESFAEGKIYYQDACQWWPQEIDSLDAIITSPPFFDSTRFHLANWLRLWFCGWDINDFYSKPMTFIDERQKISFDVYEPIFRQAKERLKKDGVMVLHLGKSKKCNMGEELAKIAAKWFKVADLFSESVRHCESHGIKDKGTVQEHQYLVLY